MTENQIEVYIASLPGPKQNDMQYLHRLIRELSPASKLWFLDGRNAEGKIVSNPNIGYGLQALKYADGKTKDFYKIGISANTGGISVYILGIRDKDYLATTYGKKIGKAAVSGYCIKFKRLSDINIEILRKALREGLEGKDESSVVDQ